MGLSQEMLAERAQLHRTYVAHVERGARNVSLSSIHRLARALEVPIAALMARTNLGAGNSKKGQRSPTDVANILLVEDNPADVELTLIAFKRARISNPVHVVHDGAEAIEYLFSRAASRDRTQAPRPDIVLLDLNLPKVNGIEVLRRLKADESTRSIPVVVLTSSQNDRDMAACRRLGAETYIVKPVDFHKFSQTTPQFHFSWSLTKVPPMIGP